MENFHSDQHDFNHFTCRVAVAVLWERKIDLTGLKVGVILSGGNVDLEKLPWMK